MIESLCYYARIKSSLSEIFMQSVRNIIDLTWKEVSGDTLGVFMEFI